MQQKLLNRSNIIARAHVMEGNEACISMFSFETCLSQNLTQSRMESEVVQFPRQRAQEWSTVPNELIMN